MTNVDRRILNLGLSFIVMMTSIFIGSVLLVYLKVPMSRLHFPLLSLAGCLSMYRIGKRQKNVFEIKEAVLNYALFIATTFVLSVSVAKVWDFSVDGRWYHAEAIIRLTEGWNPVYSTLGDIQNWSYYYPKATWYISAAIVMFFGDLESAKLYNAFFEIVLFVISIPFFRSFAAGKGYAIPLLGSILLALNPVTMAQRFTLYSDGTLGIFVMLTIIICYFIWRDKTNYCRGLNFFALFNIAAFLSHIKFTGLAYSSTVLFLFLVFFFLTRKQIDSIKLLAFFSASFITIVFIIGYSPYVKNTLEKGNPFYPLMGAEDTIDIMEPNTPESLKGHGMMEKAVLSLIGRPANDMTRKFDTDLSNIFELEDPYAYASPDIRIRGFGIVSFVIAPAVLIVSLAYMMKKEKPEGLKENKEFFILTFFQLATIALASKEIWWARYVGYLWLMPPWIAVIMLGKKSRMARVVGYIVALLVVINGVHFIANSIPYQLELSSDVKADVKKMKYYRESGEQAGDEFYYEKSVLKFWYKTKMK